MKIKTFASVAVMGALGVLVPIHSYAFGLGKINLSSALNEPFKATIPVTALREGDNDSLQVQLASNSEFNKAGLKRSFLLTKLKFEVVKKAGKTSVIITSTQAVRDPFLDFLLTANTADGKLIREYTVLLDPPKNVFNNVKTVQVEKENKSPTKNEAAKNITRYENNSYEPATSVRWSADTYQVKKSDTLSKIAYKTKPESAISTDQMMMALLKANESAFIHNNINQLKAGTSLAIPNASEIKTLSKQQALVAVNAQNRAWKNRNRVVPEIDATRESVKSTADSTEKKLAENLPHNNENESTAQLKLVVPSDDTIINAKDPSLLGDKKLSKLTEQLTLAQETIEGQAQENKDIKSRMDVMEEQLKTLHRLITLKDADLAKMQNVLQKEEGATEQPLTTEQTGAGPEDTIDNSVITTEAENTTKPQVSTEIKEENTTEQPLTTEQTGAGPENTTDNSVIATEEENTTEPQISTEIKEENTTEQPATVTTDSSEDKTSSPAEVDDHFAQLEINKDNASPDLLPEDASIAVAENSIEVDSSSKNTTTSTGFSLETAKQTFNNVLDKAKTFYMEHRNESLLGGLLALLLLILLIIRGRRKQEDLAWEQDDNSPVTASTETGENEEVETVNKSVEPEATEVDSDEALIVAAYESLDDNIEQEPEHLDINIEPEPEHLDINIDELDILDTQLDSVNEIADIEPLDLSNSTEAGFNLDELTDIKESELTNVEKDDKHDDLLDFNIDMSIGSDESLAEKETEIQSNNTVDFGETLSVDTESVEDKLTLNDEPLSISVNSLDGLSEIELPVISNEASIASDDEEITFDLGEFDGIDEAETKLDLAAAYIDMGDPEGARNILDEVVKEGNDEQKSRAQSLLNDLS